MEEKKRSKRRLGDQPKPVIQRWWRFRGRQWAVRIARFISRRRLPLTEREQKAALVSAFETIKSAKLIGRIHYHSNK